MHAMWRTAVLAVAVAALAILSGCAGWMPAPASGKGALFTGFEPIEPEFKAWYCVYDAQDTCQRTLWSKHSMNAAAISRELPNQITTTVIKDYTTDATVSYLPATASANIGYHEVVVEYAKYRPEFVEEDDLPAEAKTGADNSSVPTQLRIGVGVRVIAKVWTTKSGVDLSGLPALSLGVHAQSLYGTLTAQTIGIDSKRINGQLPFGLKLDASAIQTVLQAVASIQARIYDDDVTLTPQVLAVKMKEPPAGPQSAKREEKKTNILKKLFRKGG